MFNFTTVVFDGTSPTFYFTNTSGWNTSNSAILLLPSLRVVIRINNQITYIHVFFYFVSLSFFNLYYDVSISGHRAADGSWLSNAELGRILQKAASVWWWRFYPYICLKGLRKLSNVLSDDILLSSSYYVRAPSPYGAWGSVLNKALRYQSYGLEINSRWYH